MRQATYLDNQQMRYWFDTKPSFTRLVADRALSRFSDDDADECLPARFGVPIFSVAYTCSRTAATFRMKRTR